ncbi:DUF2855 family protein [Ramlibacter sp. G-1-2-2]|uniref:DUF2855 family protein n=1 Tax=Ramlibacter agri TaxID=2728837 RepID=A0A848H021_9BURK|nr:DUF2855 family protein [Ramlibacter agri]NML42981.1 DUF2855 family protein [Ramlibacter agri]
MSTTTLLVRKDRLAEAKLATTEDQRLAPGEVRVRIESFALTANNVTYAAFGAAMHYWDFFPVAEEGWGVVPVWGFGTVVHSQCPGVAVGERLYGYWPMASAVVLQPQRLTENGFDDGSAQRAPLPAVYNRYMRCNRDPFHAVGSEDLQSVLRPLFTTAWLLDDFLADNDFFGARTILFSSASSKTAWGTAFHLRQRPGLTLVGFTSAPNRAFCDSLGCYERVLAYQQLAQAEGDMPCVYVDFSGDAGFRATVHRHFPQLRYSSAVGGTHVGHLGGAGELPGPRPTLFFAPEQVRKRQQDWGAAEFGKRAVEGWQAMVSQASGKITLQHHAGSEAALRAWHRMANGDTDPAVGHIVSMR